MHRTVVLTAAAAAAAAFALTAAAGLAQSPSAQKAAQLATQKAKTITYQLMERGGTGVNLGTVTLQRIGSTRSRIREQLHTPAQSEPRVTLRTGSDCEEPRIANAPRSPVLLNPFTGRVSDTVVQLPLTNLSAGNYLLDVQAATARAQAIDACARLAPVR
jgi:hypothetical protein